MHMVERLELWWFIIIINIVIFSLFSPTQVYIVSNNNCNTIYI